VNEDEAPVPLALSEVDQVRYFLEHQCSYFEKKGLALQATYANLSLSQIQEIQKCCFSIAELEGIEPPRFDDPSLTGAIGSIAEMLYALGSEPDSFDPQEYPHISREVTKEDEDEEDLTQRYHVRPGLH
jgi:hypothetical protein